jgi:hypothetical protein
VASHGKGVAVALGVAAGDAVGDGVTVVSGVEVAAVAVGVLVGASLGGAGVPSEGGFVLAGPGSGGATRGRLFAWLRESGTGDGDAAGVGVLDGRAVVGEVFGVALAATVGDGSVAGSW